MNHQGTNIDGRARSSDGLQVRGTSLIRLIGHVDFTTATLHLLTGAEPTPAEVHGADHFLAASLLRVLDDLPPIAPALTARAALAARLLSLPVARISPEGARVYGIEGDLLPGLQAAAVMPVLACWPTQGPPRFELRTAPSIPGHRYVDALFQAILGRAPDCVAELNVFDALLVGWHAGFGTLLPTMSVARTVASTGATAVEALAAGVLAGDPHLAGGSSGALRFLEAIQLAVLAGTDLERAVELQVARAVANGGIVHGTGHPLLVRDPRPICLRAVAQALGARLPLLIYDEVVERLAARHDLHPNIDLASAAILLALDLTDGTAATGIALGARAFCMLAHVAEQRSQPSFPVADRSATPHSAPAQPSHLVPSGTPSPARGRN